MTMHELKCWPEYYAAIADGSKPFDVREDDRGYKPGDTIILAEQAAGDRDAPPTGRRAVFEVTYVLGGGQFGVAPGWVVLGLSPPSFLPEGTLNRHQLGEHHAAILRKYGAAFDLTGNLPPSGLLADLADTAAAYARVAARQALASARRQGPPLPNPIPAPADG